ncbi:MAG TPA: hypothetical protein VK707_05695 [Solirubrobacteraceae bacterium]|jgi:hypothetical protein|nr:hypothetical protein [Solirubrobacteraceae bacterium]
MRAHRHFIAIAGVLAALTAAPSAYAASSTLLSGYGGPGQGNQAILGSTVVGGQGGGRSGGGASGGGGAASAGSSVSESSESPSIVAGRERSGASPGRAVRSQGGSSAGSAPASGSPRGGGAAAQSRSLGRPSATPASLYPASERIPPGGQGDALGLSAADLAYIILGAGMLVSLGVLTRRLGATGSRRGAR